jgi:hypothetical protein
VLFELYKGTKLQVQGGQGRRRHHAPSARRPRRVRRGRALCIKPAKCRKYATSFAQQLVDYATQPAPDEPLLDTLAACADKLAAPLVAYLDRAEVAEILTAFLGNLASPSGAIRRAACRATVAFVRHHHDCCLRSSTPSSRFSVSPASALSLTARGVADSSNSSNNSNGHTR